MRFGVYTPDTRAMIHVSSIEIDCEQRLSDCEYTDYKITSNFLLFEA